MTNKAILIGNVGHSPDIRSGKNGDVAAFSLATTRRWKDQASGETKTATQWHKVVVYNPGLIKGAMQYVKKGSKLYIEGEIETREYIGKDDIKRTTTEIVLRAFNGNIQILDRRDNDAPPPADDPNGYGTNSPPPSEGFIDDEIPF